MQAITQAHMEAMMKTALKILALAAAAMALSGCVAYPAAPPGYYSGGGYYYGGPAYYGPSVGIYAGPGYYHRHRHW
ncbi:MAG TPA: hypothetical protein VGN52_18500 [Burkholderiales bacterium]|jgi:hypothetical protein